MFVKPENAPDHFDIDYCLRALFRDNPKGRQFLWIAGSHDEAIKMAVEMLNSGAMQMVAKDSGFVMKFKFRKTLALAYSKRNG